MSNATPMVVSIMFWVGLLFHLPTPENFLKLWTESNQGALGLHFEMRKNTKGSYFNRENQKIMADNSCCWIGGVVDRQNDGKSLADMQKTLALLVKNSNVILLLLHYFVVHLMHHVGAHQLRGVLRKLGLYIVTYRRRLHNIWNHELSRLLMQCTCYFTLITVVHGSSGLGHWKLMIN